jgi:hypothetical protein
MFKYLTKGLLADFAIKLLDNCRHLSIQQLKIEAVKCYLHGVQGARFSAIGLMWMVIAIGLIGLGTLLFHVGLFIMLPWTVEAKAILGMCMGLAYVAIGCVALHVILEEKTWMKKSGATEMLKEAIGQSNKDSTSGKSSP